MTDHDLDPRVLDALGRAVPQEAPSAVVRARVLDTAAATPLGQSGVVSARRGEAWRSLLAAAAVLLAAVAAAGWWTAQNEVWRLQGELASLQGEARSLRAARLLDERRRTEADRVSAILASADVRRIPLAGVAPAAVARGQVYVSPTAGLVFLAEGLPALPPDRDYQLWTIVDGKPVSAGVFEAGADDRAQLIAAAPPGAPQAAAVTVEPTGGVPAPTGPQYLLGVPAP